MISARIWTSRRAFRRHDAALQIQARTTPRRGMDPSRRRFSSLSSVSSAISAPVTPNTDGLYCHNLRQEGRKFAVLSCPRRISIRPFVTTRPCAQPNASPEPSLYWRRSLPHMFDELKNDTTSPAVWTPDAWQQAEVVYRLGRAKLYPDAINVDNIRDGMAFLDGLVQQRRKEKTAHGHRPGVLLHDPWLIRAWRDVALAERQQQDNDTRADAIFSYPSMANRLDQYLEMEIFAWDANMCMWLLDVWQASLPGVGHYNAADKLQWLLRHMTQDYAPHRPLDKYLVSRVLSCFAKLHVDPHQAVAVVEQLQRMATLQPDNPNVQLDLQVYTSWVNVWAKSRRPEAGDQALQILRLAQQDQTTTGVTLYNTVLNALCKSSQAASVEQAHVLWDEMLASAVPVTASSWTPLLQVRLKLEQWRPAVQLWRSIKQLRQTNVHPHRVAQQILYKPLENHVLHWKTFFHEQVPTDPLPKRVDWRSVSQEWDEIMQEVREYPSHAYVGHALLYLDQLSLAAALEPPSWVIPAADVDNMVEIMEQIWNQGLRKGKRTDEPEVTLAALLKRLRKYQGIGLLRPGSKTLDWMIHGVAKIGAASAEAIDAAKSFLDIAIEDCQYDVHHPDFVNKQPVTRLIKVLSQSPDALPQVEDLWQRLLSWHAESDGEKKFEPSDETYVTVINAWKQSTTSTPEETARRAWQLWQTRAGRNQKQPSIDIYFSVASALAEAGRVDETESLVSEVHDAFSSGKWKFRKDLDFDALRILAHTRAGKSSEAVKLLRDEESRSYKEEGMPPNRTQKYYDILLTELAEEGRFAEAQEILDQLVERNFAQPEDKICPSDSSWTALFGALAEFDSDDAASHALKLLDRVDSLEKHMGKTFAPRLFLVNCILQTVLHHSDPRAFLYKAEAIVNRLEKKDSEIKPNEQTYDLLLGLLIKARLPGKASKHLERFSRLSLQNEVEARPNLRHFQIVVHGFLNIFNDEESVKTAVGLLRLMQGLEGKTRWKVLPDAETYGIVLRSCREANVKAQLVEQVLDLMKRDKNLGPRAESYVDAIYCLASSNSSKTKQQILELSEKISQNELVEDSDLYRRLVVSYGRCGLLERVRPLSDASDQSPEHCAASLEAFVKGNDFDAASLLSDQLIRLVGSNPSLLSIRTSIQRAINVWKTANVTGAGQSAERLLRCICTVDEFESRVDSSVFADVIWCYVNSNDSSMGEAADRIVELCLDTLGPSSVDLNLIEVAIISHLSQMHGESFDRVCHLLDSFQLYFNTEGTSASRIVSSRVEAAILKSDVQQKEFLLQKLKGSAHEEVQEDDNSEPTATVV